ncbi:MAG TPA: right-handed parallel beta-helix repeat-containing protein, partial [Candidatus Bilamarchaeaceae archaeon]|nr:right-handed parallel beta-helix repeat-containing protein [Candidatus Bilamarchaeaceae archaeon]
STSALFVLDNVTGQHAVRGNFRYGGANTSNCTTSGYDDRDDVAFQVTRGGISSCTAIVSPGSYRVERNLRGNTSYATYNFCLGIGVSNVHLDCAGYSVTGNESTGTIYGVLVRTGIQNVTVTNCIVSNYTYGIGFESVSYGTLYGNTAHNNSQYGFYVTGGSGNRMIDNIAFNNTGTSTSDGFRLQNIDNLYARNNTAYWNRGYGFYIIWPSAGGNSFINNNAINNSYGFYHNGNGGLTRLYGTNFQGNTAINNTNDGFYFEYTENNTFVNNTAHLNKRYGVYFYAYCRNTVISDNFAYNNSQSAFRLVGTSSSRANNATFSNNRAYNDTQYGFYLDYVENSTFTNNTAYINRYDGFYIYNSRWNAFNQNNVSNNSVGSTAYSGFRIQSSTDNNFTNNFALGNTNAFYPYTSDRLNFVGNTVLEQ